MININLLSPELKMRRIVAKRNASLASLCVVIILVMAIIGVVAKSLESTVDAYLNVAKNNIEKDTSQIDQYQDLQDLALLINDRWKAAQAIDEKKVSWSQVLQDLNNSVPSVVQFESLTVNSDKSPNFVLQGNTTTDREIIKFKEKLEESPFFKNVSFKSSNLSEGQENGQKLKFTLEFDLENKQIESSVSGVKSIR